MSCGGRSTRICVVYVKRLAFGCAIDGRFAPAAWLTSVERVRDRRGAAESFCQPTSLGGVFVALLPHRFVLIEPSVAPCVGQ
jgi:hypothetical protein